MPLPPLRVAPSGPINSAPADFGAIRNFNWVDETELDLVTPYVLGSFLEGPQGKTYQVFFPFTLEGDAGAPSGAIVEALIDAERITLGQFVKFGGPTTATFAPTWILNVPAGANVSLQINSLGGSWVGDTTPRIFLVNSGNPGIGENVEALSLAPIRYFP